MKRVPADSMPSRRRVHLPPIQQAGAERSPGAGRRGQYVVPVLHADKTPGEPSGRKYHAIRQHYTLTFVQDKGTRAGPANPPRQRMK